MRITTVSPIVALVLLTPAAVLGQTLPAATVPAEPPAAALPATAPPAAAKPAAAKPEPIPFAGWRDGPYLRDAEGRYELYLTGRMQLDFYDYFGSKVQDITAPEGGQALKARLFFKRLRPEFGGELWGRVQFYFAAELGGQSLTNANGKSENAAAGAGQAPAADTASFAAVQSVGATASLTDDWINLKAFPELNFQLGQYDAPFSMENQTSDKFIALMERSLAIRGFVCPSNKEMGIAAWGDLGRRVKVAGYQIGVFQGDGQNRIGVDNKLDYIGRVFATPFAPLKGLAEKIQIGMSARWGLRDKNQVGYDYQAITSGGGINLWRTTYKDSHQRTTHVIPDANQLAIGGELRVPLWRFDLRSEAYWAHNQTREAVDGFQLVNTERFGQVRGIGWYAQLSVWAGGDAFITGDPGFSARPPKKNRAKPPDFKHGLELVALVSGVHAEYDGGSRSEPRFYDSKTPGASGTPAPIDIYQYAFGANYWVTKMFRASLNYSIYHTPKSGSPNNSAVVPGNIATDKDPDAHFLHELSARLGITF